MAPTTVRSCTAFSGNCRIATGSTIDVAKKVKMHVDRNPSDTILVFDDVTAEQVEFDLRGTAADVTDRLKEGAGAASSTTPAEARGRGRPKLGVVAREVTLLPRHWQWLSVQPGGASVALRRLVEEARKTHADKDRVRQAREVAYRFMSALAGNLPDFEEATRALFAGSAERFKTLTEAWPRDVRDYARKRAAPAF